MLDSLDYRYWKFNSLSLWFLQIIRVLWQNNEKILEENLALMNIHEYANEPMCIFWYDNKGCSTNFNLIPILQI